MENVSKIRAEELTALAGDFTAFKLDYLKKRDGIAEENKIKIMKAMDASEDDWNDWRWQMRNRIHSLDKLKEILDLDEGFMAEIEEVSKIYTWSATPYYLSLAADHTKKNPILLQCIPTIAETDTWGSTDPMAEKNSNPAGTITRRYPDRVIVNMTNNCAMYCRHCQRRRNISDNEVFVTDEQIEESLDYIRAHPEIRDVLLTGGDPMTMSDDRLADIIRRVREIPTVEIIRIGTRTLVTMPMRFTQEFVDKIKPYAPVYLNTHFNSPDEITEETARACNLLADNGIPLGNQMVFLKGVNNDEFTLRLLNQMLLKMRVKPYYIFHPKEVAGTRHFHISVKEGLKIHESLRGNTSGMAIPSYVVNAPGGMGKVSIQTNKVTILEDDLVEVETWEGKKLTVS